MIEFLLWFIAVPIILLIACLFISIIEAERQANKDWRNWR